ncbi:MAG: hypothetical protein MH252_14725 [Thermosynechococcaceae cyanobacterium MS004]|nr:hypothetical protein [Thermosynechococcaceae cyanobacterium MS004]
MTRLSFWNYFSFGALILSGLTLVSLWLLDYSYWLMRFFYAVALPVSIPLMLLAPIFTVATSFVALAERFRKKTIYKAILWLSVFVFSGYSFLGALSTYEVTTSASFYNQKYYLIKFVYIGASRYKLYRCEPLGLFCISSSEHIGIPYQHDPIHLRYNSKTHKVYIKNVDQVIQIPGW